MFKTVKEFLSPENSPVMSEKTNKVAPKPAAKVSFVKKISGGVQRQRMDDAIKNSGG